MKQLSLRPIAVVLVLLLAFVLTAAPGRGADEAAPAKAAAKTEKVEKARKQPRGRLPAYYATLVSAEQREKIYEIQARHAEKINALKTELAAAVKAQDDEVEAVLTPEQKEKLSQILAEAAAKRKKPAAKPPAAKPAEAASAKPAE